ncbi:hypothetical protein OHT52_06775 [Streptomyces sp. NBC_00247]|uniref:hypothetical protein n=1 Tax=Streptomyces sp. NBC_00247 TaxID=2975689 RepID=UPI002E2834C7|nr:hypothetical protein [Streptomyces sp. NBC_00247]
MTTTRARAHSTNGQPHQKDADRRSTGRTRLAGVLMILLSLMSAAGCYVVFSWWLPSDGERLQDYRAAESCSSRTVRQGPADCLSALRLTVEKTERKNGGKSWYYEATLTDEDGWRGRVRAGGKEGPLLRELAPGDQVTATVWRGDIVVVSKDGERQNTPDAPRDELQMNTAVGVFAALLAAQAFVFGAVRLVRPRAYRSYLWYPDGNTLLTINFGICFAVGLLAMWIGTPTWTVPAVAVPLGATAAGVTRYRARQGR